VIENLYHRTCVRALIFDCERSTLQHFPRLVNLDAIEQMEKMPLCSDGDAFHLLEQLEHILDCDPLM